METGNKGLLITLLNRTQNNDKVINTYFFDSTGTQTYPTDSEKITIDELYNGDTSMLDKQIKLISFESGEKHFTRAFVQMENTANCYECHSPNTKSLGYLVIDFSTQETERSLVFVRKFSLFFTIILILIIIGLVIILHYRIVKTSLSSFEEIINEINKGNLDKRIGIGRSKELGRLAKSFNDMVETFQKTQNELNVCHVKELESKNKMATIGMMASRLAHEIRNPLTGIANATEILVQDMPDDENKPILEEMRRQATRVNNAILNMLRFSHSHDLKLTNKDLHEI
ncbi:MAG: HAMP domain-containing protein, partial [Verrucomicrobiales bacterium]|nr:HAMP domain-containing protein [Verrucomicrobiales bacterium]